MNRVIINNQEVSPQTLNPEQTVGDFLHVLTEQELPPEEIITQMSVNGKIITEDNDDFGWMEQSLQEIESLEILTENQFEVAQEAMDTAVEHAGAIIPVLKFAAKDYQNDRKADAEENFNLAIDALDLFIKLTNQILQALRVDSETPLAEGINLQQLESHLSTTLQNIIKAKENDDTIALAELLEHDLVENLTQWKDIAFPKMKKIKSS